MKIYAVNIIIKLNAPKRPTRRHFLNMISNVISNSRKGTVHAITPAKALSKGDCPNCARKFSKSSNLLTAAYTKSTIKRKQIISTMIFLSVVDMFIFVLIICSDL